MNSQIEDWEPPTTLIELYSDMWDCLIELYKEPQYLNK